MHEIYITFDFTSNNKSSYKKGDKINTLQYLDLTPSERKNYTKIKYINE